MNGPPGRPRRVASCGMMLSAREAADRMACLGMDRETARRALVAGVAGEPLRTRGAHLYETSRVDRVIEDADRPIGPVSAACADGVFVGRLSRRRPTPEDDWRGWRGADLTAPCSEQRAAASGWWRMSAITAVVLKLRVEASDFVPFVGAVSGLAMLGAEIVDIHTEAVLGRPDRTRFELRAAGAWFEALAGRRLDGPTGSPWYQWPRSMRGTPTWGTLDTIER